MSDHFEITAWKVSVFGGFLVRIFPHSDWIRSNTKYLSVFSSNVGKYGPENLRIRTHFTQWILFIKGFQIVDSRTFKLRLTMIWRKFKEWSNFNSPINRKCVPTLIPLRKNKKLYFLSKTSRLHHQEITFDENALNQKVLIKSIWECLLTVNWILKSLLKVYLIDRVTPLVLFAICSMFPNPFLLQINKYVVTRWLNRTRP